MGSNIGTVPFPSYSTLQGTSCGNCHETFTTAAALKRHCAQACSCLQPFMYKPRPNETHILHHPRAPKGAAGAADGLFKSVLYVQQLSAQLDQQVPDPATVSWAETTLMPQFVEAAARAAAARVPAVHLLPVSVASSASALHRYLQEVVVSDGSWSTDGVVHCRLQGYTTPPKAREYLKMGPADVQAAVVVPRDPDYPDPTPNQPKLVQLLGATFASQTHRLQASQAGYVSEWRETVGPVPDAQRPQQFIFHAQGYEIALLQLWLVLLPHLTEAVQAAIHSAKAAVANAATPDPAAASAGVDSGTAKHQRFGEQQPEVQLAWLKAAAAAALDAEITFWTPEEQQKVRTLAAWRLTLQQHEQQHRDTQDSRCKQQQGQTDFHPTADEQQVPMLDGVKIHTIPPLSPLFLEAMVSATEPGSMCAWYAPNIDIRKAQPGLIKQTGSSSQAAAAAADACQQDEHSEPGPAAATGTADAAADAEAQAPLGKRTSTAPAASPAKTAKPSAAASPAVAAAAAAQNACSGLQLYAADLSRTSGTFFELTPGCRHPETQVNADEWEHYSSNQPDRVVFAADSNRSALGPASATSLMTLTDAGLGGRFGCLFAGISTSAGILTSVFTSALFHPEDAAMASFDVNLCGCDKVWYVVPPGNHQVFIKALAGLMGPRVSLSSAAAYAASKMLLPLLPPQHMKELGVRRIVQKPGDIVMTAPGISFHVTLSLGVNLAEAVNFMPHLTPAQQAAADAGAAVLHRDLQAAVQAALDAVRAVARNKQKQKLLQVKRELCGRLEGMLSSAGGAQVRAAAEAAAEQALRSDPSSTAAAVTAAAGVQEDAGTGADAQPVAGSSTAVSAEAAAAAEVGLCHGLSMAWLTYLAFVVQGSCSADADLAWRVGVKWRVKGDLGLLQHLADAFEQGDMDSLRVPHAVRDWFELVTRN